ncbi:protein of unknown function [Kyrpidia spormannii]|uniref:Uncharacterized protein n=1 Tax=Kyrpidia spormannii TaxID=2055160 RepID=A0ACA8ZBH2_9BACL|nr:protein of unknown function [Kyrpidia spormannii]
MKLVQHFIDGRFVESENGKRFVNINPATGGVLGEVAEGESQKSTGRWRRPGGRSASGGPCPWPSDRRF